MFCCRRSLSVVSVSVRLVSDRAGGLSAVELDFVAVLAMKRKPLLLGFAPNVVELFVLADGFGETFASAPSGGGAPKGLDFGRFEGCEMVGTESGEPNVSADDEGAVGKILGLGPGSAPGVLLANGFEEGREVAAVFDWPDELNPNDDGPTGSAEKREGSVLEMAPNGLIGGVLDRGFGKALLEMPFPCKAVEKGFEGAPKMLGLCACSWFEAAAGGADTLPKEIVVELLCEGCEGTPKRFGDEVG